MPTFAGVQLDAEYITGFPMLAALDLQIEPYTRMQIANFGIPGSEGHVGLRITDETGATILRDVEPTGLAGYGPAALSFTFASETRLLADLSACLTSPLEPGNYQASVGYPFDITLWSRSIPFSVRAPTQVEHALRAAAAAESRIDPGWNDWIVNIPARPIAVHAGVVHGPLRYHRVWRNLLYSRHSLSQFTEHDLATLDGLVAPERDAIWLEILKARNDPVGLQAQGDALVRSTPGLQWWVDAARAGRGPVTNFRLCMRGVARW